MTQYKEVKRKIENILGVKAKNIMTQAEKMSEHPISACVITNEKYTVYLFKMSEIKYDIREDGDYTVYDNVSYYAVETGSRLPISWAHSSRRGPSIDMKRVGFNGDITSTEIDFDDKNDIDRRMLFAVYNCAHMGHFEEDSLFN